MDRLIKEVLKNISNSKSLLFSLAFTLHFPFGMEKERKKLARFINEYGGKIVFDLNRGGPIVVISDSALTETISYHKKEKENKQDGI